MPIIEGLREQQIVLSKVNLNGGDDDTGFGPGGCGESSIEKGVNEHQINFNKLYRTNKK
jgi:hypothetical protein